LSGDLAGVVDGERAGSDQVHNVERGVEAERTEGLDEVRDSAETAQTHPPHPGKLSEDFKSKEMKIRQRATALYFIDKVH